MKIIGIDFQCEKCGEKSSNKVLDEFIEALTTEITKKREAEARAKEKTP